MPGGGPMKICVITTVHPVDDVRIFHKQCLALRGQGHEVVLLAPADQDQTVDGIKIIALQKAGSRVRRMVGLPGAALMAAMKQQAAVYHFHDPELIPMAVLLKLITGRKVVYDVHEDYPEQILSKHYLPKALRRMVATLVGAGEYVAARFFYDGVITATDHIRARFSYHPGARSVKNYPAVPPGPSGSSGETESREHGFKLIYVGGLSRVRGISEVVRAVAGLNHGPPVTLTLLGRFVPEGYAGEVRDLAGAEKVRYGGVRPFREIPAILAAHDCGVVCLHPLRNFLTALPIKLFEYMAAGLPVIASHFPLWRDIVEGHACGLCVDPLNPGEIAAAIRYLRDHPEEARQMGRNGREAVMAEFNWECESHKLIEFYENMLKY